MFLFCNVVRVKRKIGKVEGCELHLEVKRKIMKVMVIFLQSLQNKPKGAKGLGRRGQKKKKRQKSLEIFNIGFIVN
jgi:hypothetical protein